MKQDKTQEISSKEKLQSHSIAAFFNKQTRISEKNNTELDTERKTTQDKKQQRRVFSVSHHNAPATA